jgi:hypothetical protein
MEKNEQSTIDIQGVYDLIHELSQEDILELAKCDTGIMNVCRGVHRKAFSLIYHKEINHFDLVFVGEERAIKGYYLRYEFSMETHFNVICFFCFFIAGEFKFINAIHLYNGYINAFRTFFENQGITTVTATDKKAMLKKIGTGGIFFDPAGVIYLRDIKEIDFYTQLFSFDKVGFKPKLEAKYVYLIFNQQNGYFKIGRSKDPLKREKTLQAEEPEVALLKIWEAEPSFEKYLHKKYTTFRKRGEWFALTFKELYEIKDLMYTQNS